MLSAHFRPFVQVYSSLKNLGTPQPATLDQRLIPKSSLFEKRLADENVVGVEKQLVTSRQAMPMLSASIFQIMRGTVHQIDPTSRIKRIPKPNEFDRKPRVLGYVLFCRKYLNSR